MGEEEEEEEEQRRRMQQCERLAVCAAAGRACSSADCLHARMTGAYARRRVRPSRPR